MYYFGYGSNSAQQLEERVGHSVTVVGLATLPGHKFVYQGRAVVRKCGTANAMESTGDIVYGVLYDGFTEEDFEALDKKEGVKFTEDGKPDGRYMRVSRSVWIDGDSVKPMAAELYVMTGKLKTDQQLFAPSRDYVRDVLRSAYAAGYPDDYIATQLIPLNCIDVVSVPQPLEINAAAVLA